jgi:hypothetical protein
MYSLFYNPAVPVDCLTPVLSLDECLKGANAGNTSYQTKLVRLNRMVDDLRYNPIQKPFLVDRDLGIITGDTRYMALQFHNHISHVPVLMTARDAPSNWINIHTRDELGELFDIHPEDIITNYDWHKKPLDWIEFAYYGPACNHMHNENQRERMIRNYLTAYPITVFDYNWVSEIIDWSLYDH